MRKTEQVGGVIQGAIDATRRERSRVRRHSADVTADRLIDHSIEWDKFDGRERDAIGLVILALREIAEGQR